MKWKKILAAILALAALMNLVACAAPAERPGYAEREWCRTYYYGGEAAIQCFAAYPVLTDDKYRALNTAIAENELVSWDAIFEDMCRQLEEDATDAPDMLAFGGYLEISYTLEADGDNVSVIFDVEWVTALSHHEKSYTRKYFLADGFVYSETTVTKRLYT